MPRKPKANSSEIEMGATLEPEKPKIMLDEITRLAEEVDALNKEEESQPKGRRKATERRGSGTLVDPEVIPPTVEPDPEFEFMVKHGAGEGINFLKKKMNLMDPGITTKTKVGEAITRMIGRIQPVESSWFTDLLTIAGYLLFWFLVGRQDPPEPKQLEGHTE